MINKILDTAEDIVLIRPSNDDEKYVFAVPFQGDIARNYFDKTLANPAEREVSAFQGDWSFNNRSGQIKGSGPFHALRLDTILRRDGLWIPGVLEARKLEQEGKLRSGVY